jgi:hypothetical protein
MPLTQTNQIEILSERLRETERRRLKALVAADIEAARPMHAEDFQLITPNGLALSREEYLGAVGSGHIDYVSWEPEEIAVRVHVQSAVIRYRARLEVIFGGHRVPPGAYWHTDTYEFREGRWVVVWSQATAIS